MDEQALMDAPATALQHGCLIVYIGVLGLWLWSEYIARVTRRRLARDDAAPRELQAVVHATPASDAAATLSSPTARAGRAPSEKDALLPASAGKDAAAASAGGAPAPPPGSPAFSAAYLLAPTPLTRCLCGDEDALLACRPALRAAAELGTILAWFFVADRTRALAPGGKAMSWDVFCFMFLVLTVVAVGYTSAPARAPALLNRRQTEEWKGWMQVLFLLYHYYSAKQVYNAIRVFIAAYVWMTGYGNWAYYTRTADFSAGRFAATMWRLNLLCALCCAALNNSPMLYYICPMHTLFTLCVYGVLAAGRRWNASPAALWAKIGACAAGVALAFESRAVFYALWSPLRPFLSYVDPRRPGGDGLHEWYFRASLDRYIWVYGMACAHAAPAAERALRAIDDAPPARRRAARAALVGGAAAALAAWHRLVYTLPKARYNAVHPFTSWIPITAFIILRNATPGARAWSAGLFGWLGCITLETYISQYHTWLLSKVPDGQPVYLLVLLPGLPLLNFAAATSLYVALSHRLFRLTGELREALVPHDDDRRLARNAAHAAAGAAAALAAGGLARALH